MSANDMTNHRLSELRDAFRSSGLTISHLSKRTEIAAPAISRILSGQTIPSPRIYQALIQAFPMANELVLPQGSANLVRCPVLKIWQRVRRSLHRIFELALATYIAARFQ